MLGFYAIIFNFSDMTELVCVYRYSCDIVEFNLTIIFLNEEKYIRDGADHSFNSQSRKNWATSLMDHYSHLLVTQSEKVFCIKI